MLLAQVDIRKVFAPANQFSSLADFVGFIVRLVAIAGGLLVFLSFMYGAYLYLTSEGEKEKIDKAHRAIYQSVFGLIIIAAAYFAIQILATFFGISF